MNPMACGLGKRMEIWWVFSAFHQRRKQRRRRPWGRGEQAAVRRESLLQLARFLRPDSEVQHLSLSFPMLLFIPREQICLHICPLALESDVTFSEGPSQTT